MGLDFSCRRENKENETLTGITAAVYRYNPGIIAQAFASLDVLYPGRIGLGVGVRVRQ
jgi:alkanesulfonate monooxygenase SsuD/methylene tetrahydromethanopterin reductase-like flavin-dependent oxidoreductase (luciferase family)